MNNQTKSLIRHALTALGTILVLLGLDNWVGVVEYLQTSLDGVWDAIIALVGFVTTIIGFFRNKDRWTDPPAPEA